MNALQDVVWQIWLHVEDLSFLFSIKFYTASNDKYRNELNSTRKKHLVLLSLRRFIWHIIAWQITMWGPWSESSEGSQQPLVSLTTHEWNKISDMKRFALSCQTSITKESFDFYKSTVSDNFRLLSTRKYLRNLSGSFQLAYRYKTLGVNRHFVINSNLYAAIRFCWYFLRLFGCSSLLWLLIPDSISFHL